MPDEQPVIKTALEVHADPFSEAMLLLRDSSTSQLYRHPRRAVKGGLYPAMAGYVQLDKPSTGV
jgi:hypothetical protein